MRVSLASHTHPLTPAVLTCRVFKGFGQLAFSNQMRQLHVATVERLGQKPAFSVRREAAARVHDERRDARAAKLSAEPPDFISDLFLDFSAARLPVLSERDVRAPVRE